MLSENRYREVKNVFAKQGIKLTEDDIRLYADVFEIIAYYVNDKLTTREIMEAYDFLSDVILNRRPDIKVNVTKKERIKVQVALMDKIPFIGNKLDLNEKVMFAFCIYLGECMRVYDEETNKETNGIVLFKSVENIRAEFEDYKSFNPGLFDITMDNSANEEKPDFGYSKDNPILAVSIVDAYKYLDRLTSEEGTVTYSRLGSCTGNNGHILDLYKVIVTKRIWFKKKSQEYMLYVDSYADKTSAKAPNLFRLK